MVDAHWEDLRGRQLRYGDDVWELTGDLEIRESGRSLAVEARRTEDVRQPKATLFFDVTTPENSLNPGDLGEHFDRIERRRGEQQILVKREGRTYRYELHRVEPE